MIVGIDALPFGEWCNVTVAAVAAVNVAFEKNSFKQTKKKIQFEEFFFSILIPLMRRNNDEKKQNNIHFIFVVLKFICCCESLHISHQIDAKGIIVHANNNFYQNKTIKRRNATAHETT